MSRSRALTHCREHLLGRRTSNRCNNLTLGLGNGVVMLAVATYSDEDPWMLFRAGEWFLGARPDGQFVMETG